MTKAKVSWLTFVALVLISVVLRPPVAIVGPLLDQLSKSEGLSQLQLSLITSAPVICFGLGAFAGPWVSRRFGINRGMLAVLLVLALSSALRLLGGFVWLIVGTLGIGLAIALGNVFLPTIVRGRFASRVGLATGSYTTLLAISASYAASMAVPLANAFGGWRTTFAIWLIPAALAAFAWLPDSKVQEELVATTAKQTAASNKAVRRSLITWSIVGFFGIQSLGFYTVLGWLPTLLSQQGQTETEAGNLLALTTFIGVPTGFLLSTLFKRLRSLSFMAAAISVVTLAGFVLLWLTPNAPLIGCLLIGMGMGATFPLSLSLIATRASTAEQTTYLSAISQGWGYLLSAIGTFAFGYLREVTGDFKTSLAMMVVLCVIQVAAGAIAGRDQHIPAQ